MIFEQTKAAGADMTDAARRYSAGTWKKHKLYLHLAQLHFELVSWDWAS